MYAGRRILRISIVDRRHTNSFRRFKNVSSHKWSHFWSHATLCNHLFAFQAIDRDKGKKGKKGKGKKKGGKKKGGKKGKKMKDLTPDRYRIFLQK